MPSATSAFASTRRASRARHLPSRLNHNPKTDDDQSVRIRDKGRGIGYKFEAAMFKAAGAKRILTFHPHFHREPGITDVEGMEVVCLDAVPGTKRFVQKGELKVLKRFAKDILEALPEPTRICRRLSRCIEGGTAFHHAGLTARQRKTVEEAFKGNYIKILAATPTLAAGVNLPARRVVIRDHTRYDSSLGRIDIPVMEIKQMSGRAGRPKYDDVGEAILVAKNYEERSYLLENYVLAEPESIYSKLAVESAIRTHTLATIATGYADSYPSLVEFFH